LRIFNLLILTLALAFALITVVLAFSGQTDLTIYFVCYTGAYLLITVLFAYLNPAARKLDAFGAVVLTGFLVVIAFKVLELMK